MDWTAETDLLKRIVALLLALADMADAASLAPRAVRVRVLEALRHGARVADGSIGAVACDLGAPAQGPAGAAPCMAGDDAAAARQLARHLRAVALVWAGLLAWAGRIAARTARDGRHVWSSRSPRGPQGWSAMPRRLPHDTS